MRRLLLVAFLVLLSNFGQGQTTGAGFIIYVSSAPSGTCSAGAYQENVIGLGTLYSCQSGTWTQVGSGSGSVTSIATTAPITGGTITGTGTIACATCVKATSPGLGIAHFGGSTQEVTSSLIVAADITSGTITGTQLSSSTALPNGVTATTQSSADASTKVATTAYVDAHYIASGTKALATGAISSAACTSAQTATATGTLTTDVPLASFNGDPTAVTGYVPLTTGMLTIIVYPTADTVNFKVCNNTSASITPGAITLNWKVVR